MGDCHPTTGVYLASHSQWYATPCTPPAQQQYHRQLTSGTCITTQTVTIIAIAKENDWSDADRGFALASFFIGYVRTGARSAHKIVGAASPPPLTCMHACCVRTVLFANTGRLAVHTLWRQAGVWIRSACSSYCDSLDALYGEELRHVHLGAHRHWAGGVGHLPLRPCHAWQVEPPD